MLFKKGTKTEENDVQVEVVESGNEKEKTKGADHRVRMLIMCFAIFMCIALMPIVNVAKGIGLTGVDVARFSFVGMELTKLEEGDLVQKAEELMAASFEGVEDPEEKLLAEQTTNQVVNFTKNTLEPQAILWSNTLHKVFTLLTFSSLLMVVAFIVMIIAAAKNKKKLYLVCNTAIFVVLIAITTIIVNKMNGDFLGGGLALAVILLIINSFLCLKKEKVKK